MPALISKDSDNFRTVRFDATTEDEPTDIPFTYVHLCPVEIQRIREATLEEVQQILRRYI